jgi:DNA-binding GntR family transcriptional regulator
MGKQEFSLIEKRIMALLYAARKSLPTERIAKHLDMSRITVKKYLLGLEKQRVVNSKREGRAVYWWLSSNK